LQISDGIPTEKTVGAHNLNFAAEFPKTGFSAPYFVSFGLKLSDRKIFPQTET